MPNRIIFTGTHFTPALAVIEEIKKKEPWEIYYLGRKYTLEGEKIPSPESQILPKMGVKRLLLLQILPIFLFYQKKKMIWLSNWKTET